MCEGGGERVVGSGDTLSLFTGHARVHCRSPADTAAARSNASRPPLLHILSYPKLLLFTCIAHKYRFFNLCVSCVHRRALFINSNFQNHSYCNVKKIFFHLSFLFITRFFNNWLIFVKSCLNLNQN